VKGVRCRVAELRCTRLWRAAVRVFVPAALLVAAACDRADVAVQARGPGETTYVRFCVSCHGSGAAGAPRAGDAKAWAPRMAQGDAVLLRHAIDGMPSSGMPRRGLCVVCTDRELHDAIRYMTNHAR
jgi:cytochrome c5